MYDEDEGFILVQTVYLPDEDATGIIISEAPYWCKVAFFKYGIRHEEIFDLEDVVMLKEIRIPIETEGEE